MAIPVLTPSMKPEVGKFYMVPSMYIPEKKTRSYLADANGWVPVLGPKHTDVEHLAFHAEHYHIDWRFAGDAQYRGAIGGVSQSVLGMVLSNTHGDFLTHRIEGTPQLRRLKCKREMPDFPARPYVFSERRSFPALEVAHRACKLKPGNICPHRGIDLTPFIKDDGTAICPGHGLRWDTKSGALLPHHAGAAQ